MYNIKKDLSGKDFGYTKVINKDGYIERGGRQVRAYKCECLKCGKIFRRCSDLIKSGYSCGCVHDGREDIPEELKKQYVDGTQLSKINSTPSKANKTGVVGVNWDKSRGKWQASIRLNTKKIYLGRFEKFEDAVAARKEAEEKFFKPIIEKYKG